MFGSRRSNVVTLRGAVTGAAGLAVAATLCAGAPATASAKTIDVHRSEQGMPFTKTNRLCKARTPLVTLQPGSYRVTLEAARKGFKPQTAPRSYDFKVPTKAQYHWSNCIVKSDEYAGVFAVSIDQANTKRHVPEVVSTSKARLNIPKHAVETKDLFERPLSDKGAGTYVYESTIDLIEAAAPPRKPYGPVVPQPARSGDEGQDPAPGGAGTACRRYSHPTFEHPKFGNKVWICPDWAPSGQWIQVYGNPDPRAGHRGSINPGGGDWYVCQQPGLLHRLGKYTNTWWAYTMNDQGAMGWVPQTYFSGGGDNVTGGVPGLPRC